MLIPVENIILNAVSCVSHTFNGFFLVFLLGILLLKTFCSTRKMTLKSTWCSFRWLGFYSQKPYDRHNACRQNSHEQKINTNKSLWKHFVLYVCECMNVCVMNLYKGIVFLFGHRIGMSISLIHTCMQIDDRDRQTDR